VRSVNACSILRCCYSSVGYIFIVLFNMMSSPELKAKMDEVLEKVTELSALHVASQRSYDVKFRKLEEDVAQAQEDATDRAIKRAKRERPRSSRDTRSSLYTTKRLLITSIRPLGNCRS